MKVTGQAVLLRQERAVWSAIRLHRFGKLVSEDVVLLRPLFGNNGLCRFSEKRLVAPRACTNQGQN
jgi:hypothetical protein